MILYLAAMICISLILGFGARALVLKKEQPRWHQHRPSGNVGKKGETLSRRLLGLAEKLGALLPWTGQQGKQRLRIEQAGLSVDTTTFNGLAIIITMMFLLVGMAYPSTSLAGKVLAVVFCGCLGACAPQLALAGFKRKRRKTLEWELPSTLELLSVIVKSGKTLEGGLRTVSKRTNGVLSQELKRVEADISLLGMDTQEALKGMANRCDSPQVDTFVASVTQAIQQGTSISRVLSIQAKSIQDRHYAKSLEEINKLPSKMVPVVFVFFMPVIIVLAMAPSIYNTVVTVGQAL